MSRAVELERALSKAGACSRTQARQWIAAGRVQVDGRVVRDPAQRLDARARILLDGRPLVRAAPRTIALHKPRGYVTTRSDPRGARTVYELLEDVGAWLGPVGRLDTDTSGLLLFTNDTALANLVTSPESWIAKRYVVTARPRLDDEALERLARGVELSDGPTRPARVERLGVRGPTTRFALTITEGKNREVRRMVRAVGAKVERLARTAIGPLELGDLPSGAWRELSAREVAALRAVARKSGRRT